MVPDLPELHSAKRTPSLKGKRNSGLALRDRRPLWHPASAGRAHFDTRGQLAVPRRRLRAGAVTRSLGPSLPPPLVERLAQRDPAARLGVALPFVTVDGAGYPHPMLLSYLEVGARDARGARHAPRAGLTTPSALSARRDAAHRAWARRMASAAGAARAAATPAPGRARPSPRPRSPARRATPSRAPSCRPASWRPRAADRAAPRARRRRTRR